MYPKATGGREGKGVTLFDANGATELPPKWKSEEDSEVREYYENQPKVYQLRCEMEAGKVPTENGEFSGYVLTGVYVIGGRYAGLLPRIGEAVTGDMAYYCPAAVETREES